MFIRLVCNLIAILMFFIFLPAEDKKILEGDWKINLEPGKNNTLPNTDKAYEDVLTITGDKLNSKVCNAYGFELVSFTNKVLANKKIIYTATFQSAKHGGAVWSFQLEKDKIKGTFNWKSSEGKKAEYVFAGSKATEKK